MAGISDDCWGAVDKFLTNLERHNMSQVNKRFNEREQNFLGQEMQRKEATGNIKSIIQIASEVNGGRGHIDDIPTAQGPYTWLGYPYRRDTKFGLVTDTEFAGQEWDALGQTTYGTSIVRIRDANDVRIRCDAGWFKELRLDMDARWAQLNKGEYNSVHSETYRQRQRQLWDEAREEMARWVVGHFDKFYAGT